MDQDIGWLKTWSSFARLQMFESYKHDVAYFHAGLLPNEYYVAKGTKLEAERAKDELKVERRALDRAAKRLRARDRKTLPFDLNPAAFGQQVDVLLKECQELQHKQDGIQRTLSDLSSKRAALLEQKELASNALIELDADYEFLRDTSNTEIVCPTCGTVHTNDFSNKFGLVSDSESCRSLLIEVQNEIEIVNRRSDPRDGISERDLEPPDCLTGKSVICLSSPSRENIPLPASPKSLLYPPPSRSSGGAARDRHGRGTGCGGRKQRQRRAALSRTAKSCGPDASTPASSFAG